MHTKYSDPVVYEILAYEKFRIYGALSAMIYAYCLLYTMIRY